MLTVRDHQLQLMGDALHATAVRANVRRVAHEAPRTFATLGEPEVESRVRAGMNRAARYEITRAWDVARFALMTALFGPDFDEREEWARKVLLDEGLGPSEKMDRFEWYFRNYFVRALG